MSGTLDGGEIDLAVINAGKAAAARSGIPHAELLVGFADALLARDEAELARLREAITAALGRGGLRETASIAANFQRMVRIADSTGIPLDKPVAIFSVDLREDLGLDAWSASANTPRVGAAMRTVGRVAQPLVAYIMKLYGSKQTRS